MSEKNNILNNENNLEEKIFLDFIKKDLASKGRKKEQTDKYFVKKIKDGVFLFSADKEIGKVNSFLDKQGHSLLNISPLIESSDFEQSLEVAGLVIINPETTRDLYRSEDIDSKTKKPLKNAKPINKFSEEYFNTWKDIAFFDSTVTGPVFILLNDPNYIKPSSLALDATIRSEGLKIKDLKTLFDRKQISKKDFDISLKKLQLILPSQCRDERKRFKKLEEIAKKEGLVEKHIIDENEIKEYYSSKLIDKELATKCILEIRARDNKRKQEEDIINKTNSNIKKQKNPHK